MDGFGGRRNLIHAERPVFEHFAGQTDLSRDSAGGYVNQYVEFVWRAWLKRADYPPRVGNGLWVSCRERLPEAYVPVLVFAGERVELGFWRSDFRDWQLVMGGRAVAAEVFFWQPLPMPPQGPVRVR